MQLCTDLFEHNQVHACACVGSCAAIYVNATIKLGPVCVSNAQPTESSVGWELGKKQWSMKLTRVPP